jgi:hypothetical protein
MTTPEAEHDKTDEQLDEEAKARFADESPAPDPNPELIPDADEDR